MGDVHTGDRQLVSIQRQEKLHKVNVLVLIKRIYFQQEKHQGTCVHGIRSESSYICGPLASCHAAQSLQAMTKRPCKSGKTTHTCTGSLHLTEILQKKTLKLCTF